MRRPLNETRFGDGTVKQMPVVHMISQHDEVASAERVAHFKLIAVFAGVTISESIL